jgi:ankyrin repeat protein
VPPQFITDGLLPATINGSLGAVLLLVQAGANGDHDRASALMHAVETGRVDLATAIVTGVNPPSPTALNAAIDTIFSAVMGHLQDNHLLTEVLLCGGPVGNAANEGLFKATMLVNVEMMQLLLEYGVDINYNKALAVGHAIQRNREDLVRILLQNQSLSPEMASEAVSRISRTAPSEVKVAILSMLLVHGATGPHCNELLIAASESDDIETARLLLSFSTDQNAPPVASVDYNGARCLQVAASKGNHIMVDILTAEGHPSKFSLGKAFPMISQKNPESHFLMVQSFLQAGAEGDEVDAALANAISGRHHPKRLIELLVRNGANVNGQALIKAASHGQQDILQILLNGNPSVSACSAAIPVAMKLHNNTVRFKIIKLLLPHAMAGGGEHVAIAQAVIDVLENSPDDLELLRLLCQQGKADMNFRNGEAVILAIQHTNPSVLDFVLAGGSLTEETIGKSLACALQLPITDRLRCRKVEAILRRTRTQPVLDDALIGEIRLVLSVKGDLSVVQKLLSAGADVNAANGAPVCFAVDDARIMHLILTKRPTPHSLSMAFPIAMTLQDPARYDLCEKLLKAGATGEEISKALFVATKEGRPALALMQLLLPRADVNHNEGRVFRLVIRRSFSEGLDLLLAQRPVMPSTLTKIRAFQEAMAIKSKEDRYSVVQKLLGASIRKDAMSDALITAVNHADLPLAELLLQSGASVDHAGGQAVLAAASSGNGEILGLLVLGSRGHKPTLSTLTTGFGGAMALKDRDGDAYFLVLKILLDAGLRGEAVDAALVEAVTAGDANLRMTELIYSNGASVEWQDGEALDVAVRSGSIETLSILLGTCPSQTTLKRAYRSSLALPRDQRCSVIEMIMKAGKTIDKHVTLTLLRAAQETPADHELIKLILGYGVFDEGQAAAHAASVLDLETLNLLVESPKAHMFMTSIFQGAIRTGVPWQSDRGLSVMGVMLENGANGEAVGEALLSAVERCDNPEDSHAGAYLELFLRYNPDVNYRRGTVLQRAAQHANIDLIKRLLPGTTSDSKSMAFPYLFKSSCEESLMLQIIEAFNEPTGEGQDLDLGFRHPDPAIEPILFMALRMFPRKTQVLKALLEAGVNPDQSMPFEVDTDVGPEPFTILCWAMYQPEKKISSANIALLINTGGNSSVSIRFPIAN